MQMPNRIQTLAPFALALLSAIAINCFLFALPFLEAGTVEGVL
jgi:hypothetical protein